MSLLFASTLCLAAFSLRSSPADATPTGGAFVGGCGFELAPVPVATAPMRVAEDGRLLIELNYTTDVAGKRVVELPAIVHELRGVADLRLVVLAGNSGDEYAATRHSLAFAFGEYLATTRAPRVTISGEFRPRRETVAVWYDDTTTRAWTKDFITEIPFSRTVSGEIFYYPNLDGVPMAVVQMIGDYNEVGDFAVSILDALELPPSRMILVHDDLSLAEGSSRVVTEVQKYAGNNAQYSLIRNLGYGTWIEARALLKSKADLGESEWRTFEAQFRERADVRYANHLGDAKLFSSAFKNVESVLAAMVPAIDAVEAALVSPLARELDALRAEKVEASRPVVALQAELSADGVTDARRAELMAERERIITAAAPLGKKISDLQARTKAVRKDLIKDVRAIIERRLTFSRLALGTDDGRIDRANLTEFVLAPYPPAVFGEEYWSEVVRQLGTWVPANN